ncbi:MAG TPA: acetate--CoA ligase [Candidatus Limnocylindria bacterium]|jgi:acetyl-CoA synthetase|nr:acetate--CoA ligase [Candidatus Limnocylindria bacterium]
MTTDDRTDAATIENLLREDRTFPPPAAFVSNALLSDPDIYQRTATEDGFRAFWTEEGNRLDWMEPWTELYEWNAPYAKWYLGGKLNVSVNCLDRHVDAGLGDRVAYFWEGEPGDTRTITYAELLEEVCRFTNALRSLGVKKGDRVAIYMPMIPELPVAMLACTRIGAVHSVVFGGFSADALAGRIDDASCSVVITADGGYRKGAVVPLKHNADEAIARTSSVEHCVVVQRTGEDVGWYRDRDHWYHELIADQPTTADPEPMDSEDLLYLLYTSGTTARPKGIMHTTAGYLAGVATTHRYIFDLHPETDVYWCMADIGWVTGHSYIVYGPLANATTGIIYEGAIDFPEKDRWAQIAAKYGATILYTAPTAIRALMKYGHEQFANDDLSSLRLLGSVGEPINPEAWAWYWKYIGGERCPVVDTWWQTETGMIMITPLPGVTTLKPGSATFPFPGVQADVVDENGTSVPLGSGGYLVLTRPWPAMLRGIYGDPERYEATYWSRYPGRYFPGDGCKRDDEGYYWLLGRVDDVMNVSGHRISTTEVESALVDHHAVAEAAVVGRTDPVTGQAIFAYVILRSDVDPGDGLAGELREHVANLIGKFARPKQILFTPDLPKTRSGKIMRRLLRDIAERRDLGDVTTLADSTVVNAIRDQSGSGED